MCAMRVLSVAVPGMLAQARALARMLRAHHPDWSYEVVLIGSDNVPRAEQNELRVVPISDVLDADVPSLLERHDLGRLVSLLVPRVLEERLVSSSEPLLHLPASTWIHDSLAPLVSGISQRGVLLVPRLFGDIIDDGREPSPRQLAMVGRIATDLIGVDRGTTARRFLRWWNQRSEEVLGGLGGWPRPHDAEDWRWLLRMLELATARFPVALLRTPDAT